MCVISVECAWTGVLILMLPSSSLRTLSNCVSRCRKLRPEKHVKFLCAAFKDYFLPLVWINDDIFVGLPIELVRAPVCCLDSCFGCSEISLTGLKCSWSVHCVNSDKGK